MGSFEPVPSRDGKRIFFQGNQQRGELIKFDLKSKQFVRYLSGLSAEHLHFSKDGEWIAYITYPEGSLWRCKRDGSQKLQLSFPPVRAVLPRWSPDGRTIAFTDREKAPITADIYVVALEGGQPQKLSILPQLSRKVGPSWSPDGNELAFEAGIRQVGRTAIYLLDRKRNEVTKLLGSDGFSSPTWSPDGRFISARPSNEAENFALFEFATQKWIELDMVKGWWSWSRTGKYIYFADYSGKSLARVDVDSRRVERLASLEGLQFVDDGFGTWMALTPDDCPLFLRDVGSQDIYALDWEAP
jgi:Tol biopolymer transport system component